MDINLKRLVKKVIDKESSEGIIKELLNYLNENDENIVFNWHPLGFVHSKLCEIPKVGDLRLHVWLEEGRRTQLPKMPIHDHVFKINSVILSGTVTNHIYEITSDNGKLYRLYEAKYNNKNSILSPTELLLKSYLKNMTKYKKDDFYIVEKEVFHETIVDEGEFAATLVIATEKDETKSPKILGPVKAAEYFYSREVCNEPILKILNDKLL